MRLRYRGAGQPLSPIVVVALRAGEVELSLAPHEDRPTGVDEGLHARIIADRDRLAARLRRDIGGERQQLGILKGERRRLLSLATAEIDALLEIDRAAERRVEFGIARSDAFHADLGIAMA